MGYKYYRRIFNGEITLFRRIYPHIFGTDKTVSIYRDDNWNNTSAWTDYEFQGYLERYSSIVREISRKELRNLILTLKLGK